MQSNQMCDDDNIDDALEKVTIEDALQELFQNQEKLRVAERSSCTRDFRKEKKLWKPLQFCLGPAQVVQCLYCHRKIPLPLT